MKKKLIIGMSLACAAILASTTALTLTHNKMLTAKAGGNERTLVLDKNVSLTTSGSYGSSSIGMMSVSTYQTSQLEDGYANAKLLCVYYPDYISNINTYGGFEQATVTSISISYKVAEAGTLQVKWGGRKGDGSLTSTSNSQYITEETLTVSDDVQTFTVAAGSNFIDNQTAGKNSGFPSVYLFGSIVVSLYNITINYTCL